MYYKNVIVQSYLLLHVFIERVILFLIKVLCLANRCKKKSYIIETKLNLVRMALPCCLIQLQVRLKTYIRFEISMESLPRLGRS